MKNILLVIICSFFFITCSSTGPSSSTTGTATADVETGSVDIGVDESFTVTFSAAVNAATVSTESFFVVPDTSSVSSLKFATYNSSICDASNAIDGTVTLDSGSNCNTWH